MNSWPMDAVLNEHHVAKYGSDTTVPKLTERQIEQNWRKVDESSLKYLRIALRRLLSGERTQGIPEAIAQESIKTLKIRIEELEEKLK